MEKQFTFTLGRTLNPKYLPNQLIISLTLIAFILAFIHNILTQTTLTTSLINAFLIMLITFLTWALTREIDPAHDYAAIVTSLIILLLTLQFFPIPNILLLFWLILATRYINHTTGLPTTILDSTLLFVLSAILMLYNYWFIGFLSTIYYLQKYRSDTSKKYQTLYAILSIILMVFFFLIQQQRLLISPPNSNQILIIALGVLLLGVISVTNKKIGCIADATLKPVPFNHIKSGQYLLVFSVLVITLFLGPEKFSYLSPVWTILITAGIYAILYHFLKRKK
jgi:hypothetical protein